MHGVEKVISRGKCTLYLVVLLEARQATAQRETQRTADQDMMDLTTCARLSSESWRSSLCARCLISREQLYLYTIELFICTTNACYLISSNVYVLTIFRCMSMANILLHGCTCILYVYWSIGQSLGIQTASKVVQMNHYVIPMPIRSSDQKEKSW